MHQPTTFQDLFNPHDEGINIFFLMLEIRNNLKKKKHYVNPPQKTKVINYSENMSNIVEDSIW